MTQPLGTAARFKHFVEALVMSNGNLLEDQSVQLSHVAPQIGSILQAYLVEGKVHLFRLNSFARAWSLMATEAALPRLMLAYVIPPPPLPVYPYRAVVDLYAD